MDVEVFDYSMRSLFEGFLVSPHEDFWSSKKYVLPLAVSFSVTFLEEGELFTWWSPSKIDYESVGIPSVFGTDIRYIEEVAS